MTGLFASWPYPAAVTVLALIALARGGLTYGLGRAADAGAHRTRVKAAIESPAFVRARATIGRWGPPVVSVSFLTVGFQTLVNLAAGFTAMPLRRYVPALLIGATLWGFLYATVGFVTFAAWSQLYAIAPVPAIVIPVVLAVILVVFIVTQARASRRAGDGDSAGTVSR